MAQTMASFVPLAETDGVAPGFANFVLEAAAGFSSPLAMT
jgi:hypothetical protein